MAFDRAKTSLQSVEDRLRRLFNLAGTIGASFEPAIKPVVLAGDLDGPGYASFRGRHWSLVSPAMGPNALANDTYSMLFPVDVVVYGVGLTGIAANSVAACYVIEPEAVTAAMLATLTAAAGTWDDNKSKSADPTPFFDSGGRAVNAAISALYTNTRRLTGWANVANATSERDWVAQGGGMMLPAGSLLSWQLSGIQATVGFNLVHAQAHGRIF